MFFFYHLIKIFYSFQAKLLEASQITQNWMQAAAAAAAAAAVNSPQATTSGPPRTPPSLGGGNPGGSPVGGQGAGACNASNPNMSSKGKFPLLFFKLEKILKASLDSIPSPSSSVKIHIMDGKFCLSWKGKTLLGVVVNKLLKTRSLLTLTGNVLPYYLK